MFESQMSAGGTEKWPVSGKVARLWKKKKPKSDGVVLRHDAASACTQVKMEDAPTLLKPPESECPASRIRTPRHKWPKTWQKHSSAAVLLERHLYRHFVTGLLWERHFEKVLLETDGRKRPLGNVSMFIGNNDSFYPCTLDDIKMEGKTHNLERVWMRLMKQVQSYEMYALFGSNVSRTGVSSTSTDKCVHH